MASTMQPKIESDETLDILREVSVNPHATLTIRFLKKKSDEYERLKDDLSLLELNPAAARVIYENSDGFSSVR